MVTFPHYSLVMESMQQMIKEIFHYLVFQRWDKQGQKQVLSQAPSPPSLQSIDRNSHRNVFCDSGKKTLKTL